MKRGRSSVRAPGGRPRSVGVAVRDGGLEALRERLDRRPVAEVLVPLPLLDQDALLLLLDVRHSRKCPLAGRAMVAGPLGESARSHGRSPANPRPSGRRPGSPPSARPLDGRLLGGHGRLARARARPRDGQAYFFGVTGLIDAFIVAIQIPNLVPSLLADAVLSGAFLPVLSESSRRARSSARGGSPRRSSADAARPRRADRGLHPARAPAHEAVRSTRRRLPLAAELSRILSRSSSCWACRDRRGDWRSIISLLCRRSCRSRRTS